MVNRKFITSSIVCLMLILGWTAAGLAEYENINLNKLIEETQMMSEGADDMTLVWWMPNEFWQVSFAQEPSISAADAQKSLDILKNYTIVMLVDGTIGTFGGVTYKSETYLRNNTTIIDKSGNIYVPLTGAAIDADIQSLLSAMKPIFANMLGPMGENMHFLIFPGNDNNGKPITDALQEGTFTVNTSGKLFKFRLPLGALLPVKYCPVDGEEMSGAWKYCPYHGTELKVKE